MIQRMRLESAALARSGGSHARKTAAPLEAGFARTRQPVIYTCEKAPSKNRSRISMQPEQHLSGKRTSWALPPKS